MILLSNGKVYVDSRFLQFYVLEPLLWNMMYGGVLKMSKLEGTRIITYADSHSIGGYKGKTESELERKPAIF